MVKHILLAKLVFLVVMIWQPAVAQMSLPTCTTAIDDTDNDGVDSTIDIDKDGDGLIEICDLEGLNEIRYQLDGSGYKTSADATLITDGCPDNGCIGYELVKSLDFDVDANYRSVSNKMEWAARADKKEDATNSGWIPIGESFASFRGIFEGNGYTISNLYMLSSSNSSGLYLELHAGGEIKNVGLSDVHIRGYDNSPTGSLVGLNGGKIINSYVASGTVTGGSEVGGLVGSNAIRYLFSSDGVIISTGTIVSSFAHVDVSGDRQVGGLVGYNQGDIENTYSAGTVSGVNATSDFPVGGLVGENGGSITNSYTMSRVVSQINNASFAGGLIGSTTGTVAVVTASYWDKTINAGLMDSANAKATMELQNPTAPGMTTTEVYYGWSSDDWDFGDSTNYPALRYATGPTENACNPDITISAMVPACATLLPNQSNRNKGLTGVFLLSGRQTATVTSLPKFSPLVFSYDIKIVLPGEIKPEIQLRPYAFNDDATIKITEPEGTTDYFAGKQSGQLSDPVSDKLAEEDETTLMIVVTDVINENTTTTDYTFKITRERLPFETTSIVMSPDPADVIAEGSAATITFMVSGGTENYEYEYFIDDVPLPSPSPSPFDFSIPDDLVEDDAALKAVTLKIKISEIGGASQTTEHTVNLMVQKVNNGSATIDITDMSGTLTATVGPDPDGDADDPGYVYQWQQRSPEPNSQWMDIMSATNASLVTDDSTKDYRVKVTYTDGQGYVTDVIGGPYRTNIDNDGDGLIEIYTLEDLDAIHIEAGSAQLEDEVLIMHGCPEAGCIGYELVRSLDFNDPNSYQSGIVNTEWTTGVGWGPLDMADFDSTIRIFEGNGYTISNLYINRTESIVGLFSILPVGSVVKNVGLLDVNIRDVAAKDQIGSLVGNNNGGTIINSYATGNIEGSSFLLGGLAGQNNGQIISSFVNISINGSAFLGGLVGWNGGNITNSYAIGEVNGSGTDIGGLVGRNTGSITYSYAANEVIGSVGQFGGLVGANDGGNIIASYWDSQVNENIISPYGISTSTVALQSPTVSGAKTMAIYYDWDDEVWDFGDSKHYPALRYAAGDNLNACNNDVRASFAVPACGVLLPNQFNRRGLATVFFFADDEIADIIMSPPFSSLTENYVTRVVTEASEIGLQPYAIQDGATIKITAQGSARDYFAGKQNGVLSDGIPLADGTTITIVVTDMVDGSPDNTTYTFAITRFTSLLENLEVEISPKNDDGTVNEGSDVTITVVEVNYGTGDYEYEFSIDEQSSPPQSAPFFMYTVPIDLVDAQNTTQAVALKIKVTDQHIKGDTLEHIEELTVRKVDSGLPAIDFAGTSKTLTVTIGPDPDDVSSSSTYEYEWQQQVPGSDSWASLQTMATDAATGIYNIPEDTPIGTRFRAAVTLSDGQNITMVIVGNYLYRGDVMDDNNNGLVDIYTLEDLDAIRNNLNASYELRANLDFNDRLSYADTRNMSEWAADEARSNPGWVPIPASGNFSFSGVFDGNGHTISNLYINTEGQDDKGLFSMLGDGGEIKNVRLLNIYVQGNRRVGGLVGVNSGTIISSHVTGTVRGSHNIVGGLVGLNNENKVISSFANVAVLGNSLVGGLAGQNFSASVVNSYAVGNVRGRIDVGGLVGSNIRNVDFDASLIINSYATGNVIGTHPENSQNIGGLVGYNGGQIENTYAEGAVSSYSRVGGLVGSVGGPITKSYAIGKVSGSIEMGGLAGYNSAIGSYITKSYWDIDTSGIETSAGGSSKTTVQLQSPTAATGIYNDWDINDWNFGDSTHYPALRYTEGGNLDACNTSITTSTVVPCRVLLPNQRDRKGLATIFFFAEHELAQVTLSQPFSPLTESYDIIIIIPEESAQDIQLSPYAINNNATIAITDQSGQSYFAGDRLNGALSDEIRLGGETTVTVVVTEIIDGASINTIYTFTITKVRPLEISGVEISPQNDDGTINEGVDVTITVESIGGTGNNEYEFSIDEESLPPQSTPSFTYTVPADFVDAQSTTRAVVLKFVVIDKGSEGNMLEHIVELTVRKVIDSKDLPVIDFSGTSKTLTVTIAPAEDAYSRYEYEWQQQAPGSDSWTSIQTIMTDNTTANYNVPEDTPIDTRFRAVVTLSDGSNIFMVIVGNYLYRGDVTDDNNNGLVDIYTLEDLDAIRNNLNASYELRANLDFNDRLSYADTKNMDKWIADEARSNPGWVPIPASGNFSGVFDGNGYTISNLYINTEGQDDKGLFSILGDGGEIKNVRLLNVDVQALRVVNQGGYHVGGLVGTNSGTIISSHVTGTVIGSRDGIGGLVGINKNKVISSFANVDVRGNVWVGGLIGRNFSASVVNSYALGNVRGYGSVGGLVGSNSRNLDLDASFIINSYAIGNVIGTHSLSSSVGGLVGFNGSQIENTYAEGAASGGVRVGGLVGDSIGAITESYAIGRVTGNDDIGGLVGYSEIIPSITASYWNIETSGIETSVGGSSKTTVQLQSPTSATGIYNDWDINDWDFGDSTHYPALRYTEGANLDACNTDITTPTILPLCRILLPNQRNRKGLDTIFFFVEQELAQMTLSQPFSPRTESYDIIIIIPEDSVQDIQLSPYAINNNATIAITDQSGQSYFTGNRLNGALSDEIRLGDETTVTVVVTDIIDGSSANTTYTFTITKVRPLEISDVGISPQNDDGTINEGVDVTITVESTGGTGNNEYEFSIDGESLPPQSTPSFTYTVPVDLVDAQNTTRAVVLKFVFIDKGNEDNALEYMAELTVRKVDNGLAATNFVGTSKTLTVIIGPDPDDVSSRSTYEYQWQRQAPGSDSWTSIQTTVTNIATAIYNVPGDTPIGSRFRVLVTLSDGQNIVMVVMGNYLYRGNITDDNDNGLVDIYTLEDLDAIRNNPAASYELRADLDFKDPLNYADTRNMRKWIADETRSNAGWAPIPASGTFFGVFNGNGHTISNLYINTEENNKGLFSILGTTRQIDNILQRVGEIKNVGLLDVDVQGGASVGGLVGRNSGTIISSHVTGTVKGSINVGGLVGENSYRIISSFANANIAASHSPSGGLIGLNVNSSVVNSYALGNVQGNHLSGGLVGRNSFSSIINSYATGDITGTGGQSIGGLVGSMEDGSHIENTYAEGTVSGMSYLGGLVGKITSNNDEGTIINSYAISRVRSDSRRQVGGLVGSITGNYSITASYWDLNTSGITESAGGEGKTTEQLQSPTTATGIYSGWNTNDWNFGNSTHYPALHYTEGGDLSACNTDIEILADTPLCRILLPNQSNRKGLATVFFFVGNELAQATFFPPFSPHTESYDVITVIPEGSDPDIQLAPHAINDNATIAITDQDNQNYYAADRSDGTLSDIVTLGDETTLTIVVTDIMDGASTYTTYTFVIRKVDPITISRVMISAQPAVNDDKTINEGSTATIIFDPVGGIGNYQYFIDGQLVSSPSIVYKVPTDFIKSNSTITQTVILPSLVIRDESQEIVHTEELTIRKIDNGRPHPAIAFDTNPSQLRVFSAINDPDGEGVYTMQWQSKLLDQAWTAITDAIMATYQPPEDADRRTLYRAVNIKHTDAQGYQTEGYPTLGPFPILLSLTAEAPAILSRTDDFTYLLEVAVHADTVSLTPTASTGNVVYQVDDETETEVMNRVPFTATLAEDSQTVTITLARPNQDAQPLIYTINIERFLSANIKVFLEGLLK